MAAVENSVHAQHGRLRRRAFLRRVAAAGGAAALACGAARVAMGRQEAGQTPPIHVATRLVQIAVIAQDKNGPVADLTRDDFAILDRGKPRSVAVFSVEEGKTAAEAAASPLPPNTFSDLPQYNVAAPRSVTIVLLDNLNTLYGSAPGTYESTPTWFEDLALANAKVHLVEFIKQLDPRDRVAIYGLSHSLHVLCDFTSDREQLLAILKKYDTTSVTNREVVEPGATHTPVPGEFNATVDQTNLQMAALSDQGRAGTTMAALQAIVAHVTNIPGRKNLVWLTANLPFSGEAIASILSPARIAAYPVDGRGLLTATPPGGVEGVLDEDAAAKGNFMPAQSPQPMGIPAMLEMAEKTGGQAFVNTNDLTGAIRTAVEGSSVTYTLGFYLEARALDGKFHGLKVQVKRSGVRLRYPNGYFAYQDKDAAQDQSRRSLMTAVASPLQSSAIPVRVRIARVDLPFPKSLSLFGSIDIRSLRLAQAEGLRKGEVDVFTIEQDQTGKVLRQSASRIRLSFSEAQYAEYLKAGFGFHQIVQPQEGVTSLRVVVEEPGTAEVGSLIVPLSEIK